MEKITSNQNKMSSIVQPDDCFYTVNEKLKFYDLCKKITRQFTDILFTGQNFKPFKITYMYNYNQL